MNGFDEKKITERRGDIEALAATEDGKRVKELLGGDGAVEDMVRRGDTDALKRAVGNALKTPEGASLLEKLREIMK